LVVGLSSDGDISANNSIPATGRRNETDPAPEARLLIR
jgi:hypothetical protein